MNVYKYTYFQFNLEITKKGADERYDNPENAALSRMNPRPSTPDQK